jgi:DNA polymerase epsilon subunit 1
MQSFCGVQMSEDGDNDNDRENSDQPSQSVVDIEDSAGRAQSQTTGPRATVSLKRKRDQAGLDSQGTQGSDLSQNWRDALGPPPPMGKTKVSNVFADL